MTRSMHQVHGAATLELAAGGIVAVMEGNVASAAATTEQLFDLLASASPCASGADGPVELYFEQVARLALNWMALGDDEELRDVLAALDDVIRRRSGVIAAARQRAAAEVAADEGAAGALVRAATQITVLLSVISVYLRTDNVAKVMAALAPTRRTTWRDALLAIYRRDRPVTARELAPLLPVPSTAHNALKKLSEIGVLEKLKAGPSTVVYGLTPIGRRACSALEQEKPEPPVVSGAGPDNTVATGVPDASTANELVEPGIMSTGDDPTAAVAAKGNESDLPSEDGGEDDDHSEWVTSDGQVYSFPVRVLRTLESIVDRVDQDQTANVPVPAKVREMLIRFDCSLSDGDVWSDPIEDDKYLLSTVGVGKLGSRGLAVRFLKEQIALRSIGLRYSVAEYPERDTSRVAARPVAALWAAREAIVRHS